MKRTALAVSVSGLLVAGLLSIGPVAAQESPAPASPTSTPVPEAEPHTVVSGEHLWSISAARLGAGERWVELFVFNSDTISNPHLIEVGQVLKIPTAPVVVSPRRPCCVGASASASAFASTSTSISGVASQASAPNRSTASPARSAGGGNPAGSGRCGGNLPSCSIMNNESGGNPNAVNASGCGGRGCYGKWQFDPKTSQGLGYDKPMNQYPESVQDEAAAKLWAGGSGCSHWGAC